MKRIHPSQKSPRDGLLAISYACLILAITLPSARAADGTAATPAPDPESASAEEKRPDPIDRLIMQGNRAARGGHMELALQTFTAARALAPERYDVRVLLADLLRRNNDSVRARNEFQAAVALDPSLPEAYIGQALIDWRRFNHAGAAAIAVAALEKVEAGRRAEIHANLAETRRRQGRLDQAVEAFREAIALDPEIALAHAGLGRVAEQIGQLDAAIGHWDRYLELRPEDEGAALRRDELEEIKQAIDTLRGVARSAPGASLFAELGRLYDIAGDRTGAAGAYRNALELEPEHVAARRGLAVVLRNERHLGGALVEFRRVLKHRPSDPITLYNIVALAAASRNLPALEEAWLDLIEARPDDLFAARAFTRLVARRGDDSTAGALERLAGFPPSASRDRLRALLLASMHKWQDATAALYAALRADPTDPRTLQITGEILNLRPSMLGVLAGKVQEERAAGKSPGQLAMLGRLTALSGRWAAAMQLAEREVAEYPESSSAHSLLAESIQASTGDLERALVEMRRAVELAPDRVVAHVDLSLTLMRAGRLDAAATAARAGSERLGDVAELQAVLGGALTEQGEFEPAAAAYRAALEADPADNLGLSRGQYPIVLAALGRNAEARHALLGVMPPMPDVLYDEAWNFVRHSNSDRTFNGQDWDAWRDRYAGELVTVEDAYQAIVTMLASLGDRYSRLRGADETAAMYLSRRGEGAPVDRLGRKRRHGRTVIARDLPGGRGYIQLNNLTDPRAVEELRQALSRMQGKEEIILDLRGNTGGLNRTADAIGDLLAGPGKQAGTDLEAGVTMRRVTAGDGALTDSPITVLVDGQTASAAERLARTLEETGRAEIVGDATYGKGKYQITRVLPGGVTVLVSKGEMLDRAGRPMEKRGLKPRRRRAAGTPDGQN